MRAYSAGGVVFRLVPLRSPDQHFGHSRHKRAHGYKPARQQTKEARSAGHASDPSMKEADRVEVVLVGRSHAGIWVLPKGTPQPGETIEQVALREVQEETGLQVRLIAYIGSISYSFVREHIRYHKQVRHFLLEAIGGDISLHDQEYDQVKWFSLHEASRHLTYQNEVRILNQAEEILHRWLHYQWKERQL
ncbi:NUDIX domain-containing protein [Thermosporothrix hazakensis]|uniref:NUDIX domain-containing protein n=2 Tax=Thermosporothrix hazakensis TaxID=644383 RepID=A0A326U129_THEHA|nr:NUDIX domain-containing protein [Thermosporothrix hazakensis]GCE47831.1 hypothetical protein KTH_27000 [Thermosporothrix hazakensis]